MPKQTETTLEEKVAKARYALSALIEATQDPAVRAAICDGFWEEQDLEVFEETAELLAQNYAEGEPIRVRCSISLPDFFISFKTDKDTEEDVFEYENIGEQDAEA